MTQHKDFKRLIRARMAKTGESYAAARHQLITDRDAEPSEFADLADISHDAVREKTGRDWHEWVGTLDAAGCRTMDHTQIAKHISTHHSHVSFWWAQSVAIGYERIRGLRVKGQSCTGSFDANKSKTFAVPVSSVYSAWVNADLREQWMPDLAPQMRTCQPNKSVRMALPDGTLVNAYFTDKGPNKCAVQLQQVGMADKAAIVQAKADWTERLSALNKLLKP